MKVYQYYLVMPDLKKNDSDDFQFLSDDAKNEFLSSLQSLESKFWDEERQSWYFLYAHTTNKDTAEWFESFHNMDLFYKKKRKMTENAYENFRKENVFSYLKTPNEIIHEKESERGKEPSDEWINSWGIVYPSIPTTGWEDSLITEDMPLIIESKLAEKAYINYSVFYDDFIKILDSTGYCNSYLFNIDDEAYSYQSSYGISAEGYYKLVLMHNYMSSFVELFYPILKRED